MHMHWARLIELLHSAEVIKDLLNDPDLQGNDLVVTRGNGRKRARALLRLRAERCSIITRSMRMTR